MKWWDWIAAAVIGSLMIGTVVLQREYLSDDSAGIAQNWLAQLWFLVALYVGARVLIVHLRKKRRERAHRRMSGERRTVVRKPRGGSA